MTRISPGQVWVPHALSAAAPRQVKLLFTDVAGAAWLQWFHVGFPERGTAQSVKEFRVWIWRNAATLQVRQ